MSQELQPAPDGAEGMREAAAELWFDAMRLREEAKQKQREADRLEGQAYSLRRTADLMDRRDA